MKKWTNLYLTLVFCAGLPLYIAAQSRAQLEAQRKQVIEQLEIAEQQVKLAEQNTQTTVSELSAINSQIRNRKKLIANLDQQLQNTEKNLAANKDSINQLTNDLNVLKTEYANILRLAYKKRIATSPWISIFASKSLNEAILTWRYTQQFQSFLTHKQEQVTELHTAIEQKNALIQKDQQYIQSLLVDEKQNYTSLESTQKNKDQVLQKLKTKEKELRADLNKKRKEREKLNTKIEQIILATLQTKKTNSTSTSAVNPSFSIRHSLPWPVAGYISSKFGKQAHPSIAGVQITNNGIDIHSKASASVKAISGGTIVGVTKLPGYDHMVIVEHGSHYTVYSRIAICSVSKGQNVVQGTVLGSLGTSGELHFEIWKEKTKLDPANWLKKK